MQHINQHIQTTLQDIYRKAIDADAKLDMLQQQQQGKFNAIFDQDAGFTTSSKRFIPYVNELSESWNAIKDLDEAALKQALPKLVSQLEVVLRTLASFKTV